MKFYVALAVGLCLATTATANTKKVLNSILDKPFKNDLVSNAVINSDGTLFGVRKGVEFSGTWKLKGGKYCREIPAYKLSGCQKIKYVKDKSGKVTGVEFIPQGKKEGIKYFFK
jgi:hypothetical protein